MTTFSPHTLLPGVQVHVMTPRPDHAFQLVPWLNITSGIVSINPDATRTLADELDKAWAIVDRRAELEGQPEDETQFTALDARGPIAPLHVED